MNDKCLDIITRITVELHKDDDYKQKLGSGVLYFNKQLAGTVYLLTAKHCLSGFKEREKVSLRFFNPETGTYDYITPVKQNILLHPIDDAGIVILNQRELSTIVSDLPPVFIINKNVGFDEAVTKGFPIASLDQTSETGESSLVTLNMRYLQEIPTGTRFPTLYT